MRDEVILQCKIRNYKKKSHKKKLNQCNDLDFPGFLNGSNSKTIDSFECQ